MFYHSIVKLLCDSSPTVLGPLGAVVRSTAGLPLMAWSRRAEVTADRAGLLCCGEIRTAERALLKLVTGFADIGRVDIEGYLHKSRDAEAFHKIAAIGEILHSHPLIPKRIEALRLFAE